MYSLFISKPRKQVILLLSPFSLVSLPLYQSLHQVKAAIDHMTYIKIIFLGYLRSLNQLDQAYSRMLLEENEFSVEKLRYRRSGG